MTGRPIDPVVPNAPIPVLLGSYYLDLGGSERQLTEIATGLDRRQFDPHVAVFRADGIRLDEVRRAKIPVFEVGLKSFGKPLNLWECSRRYRRYLREHNIAIAHSFDVPQNILLAPVARWARVPVVLSSQRASRDLTPGWQRRALRISDLLVDGVVVNCLAMRDHMLAEGVAESRIHLSYNSVDCERFSPLGRSAGGHAYGPVIGTVCGIRQEKGLDLLLKAFMKVRTWCPEARLLIVGSGPAEPEVRSLAAELQLGAEVCRFEPTSAEPEHWLRSIDIFVQASRSEALSNSLMEAMARGCAVVASRVGGNPELVKDNETGLLFQSGNHAELASKLQLLVENTKLREELGRRARRLMEQQFSREASLASMAAIYRRALERSRIGISKPVVHEKEQEALR